MFTIILLIAGAAIGIWAYRKWKQRRELIDGLVGRLEEELSNDEDLR